MASLNMRTQKFSCRANQCCLLLFMCLHLVYIYTKPKYAELDPPTESEVDNLVHDTVETTADPSEDQYLIDIVFCSSWIYEPRNTRKFM